MADIRPTPVSNYPAYYGAGLLSGLNEAVSKPFGYENDPVRALTNLLGIPAAVKTLENTAYGMPNVTGTGMATQLRPEAKETVGNLLPAAPALGRLAAKGAVTTGKYIAPEVGRMAEQYAAKTGLLQSVKPIEPSNAAVEGLLDYRGSHTAPGPDFGAQLHDLTGGGQMYPADVYSNKAVQYYGSGFDRADQQAFALANSVRGNPDAVVTMYRAVPKNKDISSINAGDWVTLTRDYAKTHGESALKGNYKIISKKVKAKDLWTNADSIQEFGYWPSESSKPTGLLGVPTATNVSNKFDVVARDASDIFGAGAQRIMYTDPNSGGFIDVLVKPDKTASVMNLLVPEKFRGQKIGESLQAQALKDFPELSGQVSKKAAAKTAYRLGRRPPYMPDASLDDVFKIIDENSSVNLVSPEMQKRFK